MERPLKILLLDNTREASSFGSPNLFQWALKMAPPGSELIVRRAPDLDFKTEFKVDALLLSGSITSCLPPYEPWIQGYDEFVIHHLKRKTPTLGVCFGHQTLARCLSLIAGVPPKLGRSKDAELGWQTMKQVQASPLFDGLPEQFISYQSHYEEVSGLPPGTIRVAESDRCAIQAFEVENAPVYGIQFHPEHSVDYGEAALKRKLEKGERKEWVLNHGLGHKLYNENVGKIIFGNFFKIAQQHS